MLRWLYRLADRARHRERVRRWPADKTLGARGEDIVHRWLERQGMIVVARNFMPPGGKSEADLIAWDGEELVVIEVKTRSNVDFGPPERNVGHEKHKKMISAGEYYARRAEVSLDRVRFDVIAVLMVGNSVEIEHFKAAVNPRRAREAAAGRG